jgi:threonine/homoserine/homoserine lactone efflux protein
MDLFSASAFWFGFSQGFVIGPISLFAIREGLNPRRGFWFQLQVILGATLVDVAYIMLAIYGVAGFIDNNLVQLVMWALAAYLLLTMGVNTYHERSGKMSFEHLHRHKTQFLKTDFFRAILMNLVNPVAVVFAVLVFGSMYGDYAELLSPFGFAMNVTAGGLLTALLIALLTLAVRHVFHQWMLQKMLKAGSLMLVGYGLWFLWKAAEHVPELSISLINFLNP